MSNKEHAFGFARFADAGNARLGIAERKFGWHRLR